MPANLHHLKSLIVDSPRHGKDKIGRIPSGQDVAPPPADSQVPPYSLSISEAGTNPLHLMLGRDKTATMNKNIPSTWQGSLEAEHPPPVPPKNEQKPSATPSTAPNTSLTGHRVASVYRPGHLARTLSITSVNSLTRLSFSSQISQLVSIQLPDATLFSDSISAISTAPRVARTLTDAAAQIQAWIVKATDVLEGLDADNDAEWAAAAGRDGVREVDIAISRFEALIQVYVAAVENLQTRTDISLVANDEQRLVVTQLDRIASDWQSIKLKLRSMKRQVELALEWEELRDAILRDIGSEIELLSRQVFEMEERRHMANAVDTPIEPAAGVDIGELETIVEEAPMDPHRLLNARNCVKSSVSMTLLPITQDDTTLLGLFARMQPLRASLDFLPMRIANFQHRARKTFRSACDELDSVQQSMDIQFARLESDAESLRRELGEDRWVLVFRNAGRQAQKMIDSVGRSIAKLDESLDSNTSLRHAPSTTKKIENYEAKKTHYCPAIERVLAIVERGVKDRLTVNGEILRLQHDLQSRWQTIKIDMKNIDSTLDSYEHFKTRQLRDSISSIMSSDPSFLSSTLDTPGDSSSASSIHTPDRRPSDAGSHTPYAHRKPRQQSTSSTSSRAPLQQIVTERRHLSSPLTLPSHSRLPQARKTPLSRSSAADLSVRTQRSVSLSPGYQAPGAHSTSRVASGTHVSPAPTTSYRPRWTGGYTPPASFPYEHPHPGRSTSSLYTPSSLAATPITERLIRPSSSLTTTPSPLRARRSSTTPLSRTDDVATTDRLRTHRSSPKDNLKGLQDPPSPSPLSSSHMARHDFALTSVRTVNTRSKRRSMIPAPIIGPSGSIMSPLSTNMSTPRSESRQA